MISECVGFWTNRTLPVFFWYWCFPVFLLEMLWNAARLRSEELMVLPFQRLSVTHSDWLCVSGGSLVHWLMGIFFCFLSEPQIISGVWACLLSQSGYILFWFHYEKLVSFNKFWLWAFCQPRHSELNWVYSSQFIVMVVHQQEHLFSGASVLCCPSALSHDTFMPCLYPSSSFQKLVWMWW